MDSQIIKNEINSKALKEVVESLIDTVNQIKGRSIEYQQANAEIVGCKHIIQSIALDWAFNGKIKSVKKIAMMK